MNKTSISIEEKLNKSDCTLEELLDEHEIIQEIKIKNSKLLNFFDKNNVKKLIDYIIKEAETDDYKKGHLYPFIASEILNCDVNEINDLFTTTNIEHSTNKIELLDYFFSFLETKGDFNNVLVGYFAKFLNFLLSKFPFEIIGYLYYQRQDILEKILQSYNSKSLSEVIPNLLIIERYLPGKDDDKHKSVNIEKANTSSAFVNKSSEMNYNLEYILVTRRNLLINLFKKLIIKEDPENISNLAKVCIEVSANLKILEIILNEKSILDLLTITLAINLNEETQESNSILNYNYQEILNVLINILRYIQNENLETPKNKKDSEGTVNSDISLENTLLGELILQNLVGILKNFSPCKLSSTKLEGTFGNFYEPLGGKRVKLLEFVYHLLIYFKNIPPVLDKILIRSDFLKNMISYFFQYEWNNIYQLHFKEFMEAYFNNINNHPEMTKYLFEELKFIEILVTKGTSSRTEREHGFRFESDRKINNGYFAVLIELCHKISIIESNNSNFKNNYSTPSWENFLKDNIYYWKKLFNRILCFPEAPNVTRTEEFSRNILVYYNKREKSKEEFNEGHGESVRIGLESEDNIFNICNSNDDRLVSMKSDNSISNIIVDEEIQNSLDSHQNLTNEVLSDSKVEEIIINIDEELQKIKSQNVNIQTCMNEISKSAESNSIEIKTDIPLRSISKIEDNSQLLLNQIIKTKETKDIIMNSKKVESWSLFKIDYGKLKSSTQVQNETVKIETKSIPFRDNTNYQLPTPITVFKNAIKFRKFENSSIYRYFAYFLKKIQSFKILMNRQEVRKHIIDLNLNLEKMKKNYSGLLEYENNKSTQDYYPKEELKDIMSAVRLKFLFLF